jgi:hypothetical protein
MEEEKGEDIATKADRMLAKSGVDPTGSADEMNVDDLEEHRVIVLQPAVTDENGLPKSMAKAGLGSKLPPISAGLIKLPQSSLLNKNGGPSKMAPMPIGTSPREE